MRRLGRAASEEADAPQGRGYNSGSYEPVLYQRFNLVTLRRLCDCRSIALKSYRRVAAETRKLHSDQHKRTTSRPIHHVTKSRSVHALLQLALEKGYMVAQIIIVFAVIAFHVASMVPGLLGVRKTLPHVTDRT